MSDDLVWEEPPAALNGRLPYRSWQRLLLAASERQGEWARGPDIKNANATSIRNAAHTLRLKAEIATRRLPDSDLFGLWFRVLGSEQ